jgi:hypothetical protein
MRYALEVRDRSLVSPVDDARVLTATADACVRSPSASFVVYELAAPRLRCSRQTFLLSPWCRSGVPARPLAGHHSLGPRSKWGPSTLLGVPPSKRRAVPSLGA